MTTKPAPDLSDLLEQPTAQEVKHTPQTTFDGQTGSLTTGPLQAAPADYDALLVQFGYDPEEVEIIGHPTVSRWQQRARDKDTGAFATVWLAAYKFQIRSRSAGTAVLDDLIAELSSWTPPAKPRKRKKSSINHDAAFVVQVGDMQWGKGLASETPIMTTEGWVQHGDLRAGMFVFGPDGKPKEVIDVLPTTERDLYRVTFGDGSSIVCDDQHQWSGSRVKRVDGSWQPVDMTVDLPQLMEITQQKAACARPFIVDEASPIELPSAELPIDPYVLGMWLGDGNSHTGIISTDERDRDDIAPYGWVVPSNERPGLCSYRVPGLTTQLRESGLLGEKVVPEAYLYGSLEQRLALVQGLMDTDGHVGTEGSLEFCNTTPEIADAFGHLLSSLGIRYRVIERIGRLNGVEHKKFRRFSFRADLPMFRFKRKLERQRPSTERRGIYRSVRSVEYIGTGPAQCITVEGSLYLAGERMTVTHNCEGDGSEGIARRWTATIDRAAEAYARHTQRHGQTEILLALVGDCIEGNQSQNRTLPLDLTITEQVRVYRRALIHAVRVLAPLTHKLTLAAVGGNHDEAARGDRATRLDDNWATEGAIAVGDALALTPGYEHVTVLVPPVAQGYMTIKVGSSVFTLAHGHQWRRGKAAEWLANHAYHKGAPAGADFLLHGHWHSTSITVDGPRSILCSSTLDGGSPWYRERAGAETRTGGLSFTATGPDFYNLEMI